MVVYVMLVNIIVINKNSSYPQGGSHSTDLRNVTTKPWLPQAKSMLGSQMHLESREGNGVSSGWEGMGTVSQRGTNCKWDKGLEKHFGGRKWH